MPPTKYLKGECPLCQGHVEFPAQLAGLPTTCPHCGAQTELLLVTPEVPSVVPKKAILWTLAAVLILGGGLLGSLYALKRVQHLAATRGPEAQTMNSGGPSTSNPSAAKASASNDYVTNGFEASISGIQKDQGSSLVYAVGTVKNRSGRQRFGVRVELDLLDTAGQKVGTAKDYQQVLEPKAQWNFKALVVEPKAVTARISAVREDQ